ncbi:MAG TPA: AMP-binding protein [Rubrobacter sp.]
MDDRDEATGLVTSQERTLGSLVDAPSWHGGRTAVLALREEGVECWSYVELSDSVRRLARGLCRTGVGRGDHVVIFAGNRPEWVAACLAVIRAGAVIVPLDAQLGDAALGRIIKDSGARFIFTDADRAERVESLDLDEGPRSILLDVGVDDERSWRYLFTDEEVELPRVEPGDPAALFYTSGTTGAAKGVPLSHSNLVFQIDALLGADLVSEDDRILLPLPLHHVYPFVMGMLTPLAAGLPIVMPQSLTGPQLVRALREGEVTLIIGVPRLYGALYSGIEERVKSSGRVAAALFGASIRLSVRLRRRTGFDVGKLPLRPLRERFGPKLRVLASGGAALDPDLAWKLEGLGWRVAVGYGLTETAPLLTLNPPDGERLGSVGRPVPGVEISIDPSAVPEESQGEILARGPNVFSGYRNRPEENSKVFTDDGWFRTGDLGYFDDDGYLYVTGRASTLIVTSSGKNVQPEDVEGAYQENPFIREIGVLQKDGRLVALIVPDIGEIRRLGDGEIQQSIREAVEEGSRHLPSYQRISDFAISREPLEYTRLGKLRRHVLDERYEHAKSGEESRDEGTVGPIAVEEMSEEDRVLMENPAASTVWDLLANRYPDRRLTPEASPQLDLDIDSLGWINLTLEISEKAGVDLDEEAIQRIDTVRDLLREVAKEAEAYGTSVHTSPLTRPEEVLDDRQKRWLTPLGPATSAVARGIFALNRVIMRGPFRLRVKGLENLPDEGPFIIAPNHVSYLDSFAVAAALDDRVLRNTYWAGWTGAAFGNPLTRLGSRLAQVVPVDPDRAGISSLAFGAAVLKGGRNLVWFAEGERSPTGRLQQFKPGMGILLTYYSVPVVPAFISGTYEAMPRGKFLRRLKQVSLTFGEPLIPHDLDETELQDKVVEAVRERVAELAKANDSRRERESRV